MTNINSKEAEATRTAKVLGNVLDAAIQINLLEIARNHRRTRTKELSSEVIGVIEVRKMMKRLKTKRVSWITHLARKINLTIIFKNKHLKAVRNKLEKDVSELKEKLSTIERNKGVDLECLTCQTLRIDNKKLKEEAFKLTQF
ncbi:hypothetical protein Tco_0076682 [Tanacetum coccineum]